MQWIVISYICSVGGASGWWILFCCSVNAMLHCIRSQVWMSRVDVLRWWVEAYGGFKTARGNRPLNVFCVVLGEYKMCFVFLDVVLKSECYNNWFGLTAGVKYFILFRNYFFHLINCLNTKDTIYKDIGARKAKNKVTFKQLKPHHFFVYLFVKII